jgi:pyruvate dehydrogenase E1 component
MGDQIKIDDWQLEKDEWLEAIEEVLEAHGKGRTSELLHAMRKVLARKGVANNGAALNTPYMNTISPDDEGAYPGDLELEQQLENIIRWNAGAMVLQAQAKKLALGGHIATYMAASTMLEVLFNHFLRKKSDTYGGDLLMIQGHASPGIYARAVLEGRLSLQSIADFRQETIGGVCSYPHPRRMPKFWQAPSVSMGLGPLTAIYQARFMKYLENHGLKPNNGGKIWHFIGDGEIDEVEIMGSINVAIREGLDNLIFVVHCNLQRLDGPVRGNGKIIQEVERSFLGSGWETIKVLWAGEWDALLENDTDGVLLTRLEELVDGDYQEIVNMDTGAQIRAKIANGDERILALLADYTDEQLKAMKRGGHDHKKVYAAYDRAIKSDKPVCILMKTVKGYGLGSSAEGKNTAHQFKEFKDKEKGVATNIEIKNRYKLPLTDEQAAKSAFYIPSQDEPVIKYLHARRQALGGYLPERSEEASPIILPEIKIFDGIFKGSAASGGKEVSTTGAMVQIMTILTKDANIGKYIVPIVPDEAQTFGMEPLFNSVQIYNPKGQIYTPLEIGMSMIKYKESTKGQVLQEGINEAGALASFTAAGTAYSTHGIPIIPFYIYYSIFGFQRVGDSIYAAGDMLCKGFLLGATAGRTTLNGEGLQHEDGHSLMMAQTVPSIVSYDPAFAYELAVIVHEGIRRMYIDNEKIIFYLTIYNENLMMPEMPKGVEEGIKRGIYKFKKSTAKKADKKAHLFGSGVIMKQVLEAAEILENEGIATDIWSVTSWIELYRDAESCLRNNLLNPGGKERTPYIQQALKGEEGVFVSANDWMKITAGQLAKWMPQDFIALGTDGYGLSESRPNLRDYFEISPKYIAFASVRLLQKQGKLTEKYVKDFMKKYNVVSEKVEPMSV